MLEALRPLEAKFEVALRRERPSVPLPLSLNEKLAEIRPVVSEMVEEAPEHLIYQAATHDQSINYVTSAPRTSIVMNVCCAGVGVKVEGTTVYYITRYVGATMPPGGVPVVKVADGATAEQGKIVDWGRMGGPFGWSADRDLIAGALASFIHNWVGLLALFRERPSLPFTGGWYLPNMTLEETRKPEQFVMPAPFTYRLWRPSISPVFVVNVSSETPIEIGLDWWDAGKGDIAKIPSIELQSGDNQVAAILRGAPLRTRSGYFTINVIDAPKGLTVSSVTTRPPSF